MPLYEYMCEACEPPRRFEVYEHRGPGMDYKPCPACDVPAPLAISLYAPRPDGMWAGHKTQYGYFTSASSLKAEMMRRNHVVCGDRTDREGMDKVAEEAQKAKDVKLARDMRKWSEKAFGPSGLGLGGADGEKMIKEHTK